MESESAPSSIREVPDVVHFTAADGIAWRAAEHEAVHVPGAYGARCLIFVADGVARRVWDFPDDWRLLSPRALEALMAGTGRRAETVDA
jgi:hypothetical protein